MRNVRPMLPPSIRVTTKESTSTQSIDISEAPPQAEADHDFRALEREIQAQALDQISEAAHGQGFDAIQLALVVVLLVERAAQRRVEHRQQAVGIVDADLQVCRWHVFLAVFLGARIDVREYRALLLKAELLFHGGSCEIGGQRDGELREGESAAAPWCP